VDRRAAKPSVAAVDALVTADLVSSGITRASPTWTMRCSENRQRLQLGDVNISPVPATRDLSENATTWGHAIAHPRQDRRAWRRGMRKIAVE